MVEIVLRPHPAISQQHGFVHGGAVSATLAQAEVFVNTGGQEKLIALLTATLMAVKGRDGVSD